jgi:hypothetical protein
MGIEVSKSLGQRYTETAGAAYEQLQEDEVERLEQGTSLAEEQSAEKLQISADGAMVPLLHGVWAEVKTLVIGEVKSVPGKDGEPITKTGNLTYFSRKTCSETFERLALVETHRCGIANAKKVAAIMDGAEWLQGFTDYHCPQATRILDFPHAAEHVGAIGEVLHGEHTSESRNWKETRLHQLKHDGPDSLMDELAQIQQDHPDCPVISSNLAYLQKRREQLFDRGCGTAYTTCRGEPEIPKEPLQHHPVILIQHLERVRDFGLFLLGAPAQAGGHNVS